MAFFLAIIASTASSCFNKCSRRDEPSFEFLVELGDEQVDGVDITVDDFSDLQDELEILWICCCLSF